MRHHYWALCGLLLTITTHAAEPNLDALTTPQWLELVQSQRRGWTTTPPRQWKWLSGQFESDAPAALLKAKRVLAITLQNAIIETTYFAATHGIKHGQRLPLSNFFQTVDLSRHAKLLAETLAANSIRHRQTAMLIAIGNISIHVRDGQVFLNDRYVAGLIRILLTNRFKDLRDASFEQFKLIKFDRIIRTVDTALAINRNPESNWQNRFTDTEGRNLIQDALANVFKNGSEDAKMYLADLIRERYSQLELSRQTNQRLKIHEIDPDRLLALALHDESGFAAAYLRQKSRYASLVLDEFEKSEDSQFTRVDEHTHRSLGLARPAIRTAIDNCQKLLRAAHRNPAS